MVIFLGCWNTPKKDKDQMTVNTCALVNSGSNSNCTISLNFLIVRLTEVNLIIKLVVTHIFLMELPFIIYVKRLLFCFFFKCCSWY